MTLQPGDILQNRYTIKNQLGEGGMGTVYVAADNRLNIDVAIKELIPQPGIDPVEWAELRAQFRQEAVTLARLNHPNLVKVSDYFEIGSNSYFVMSLAVGKTLEKIIVDEGACSEQQVISWATALLGALAHCHHNGVIHRDIKPANIIIQGNGSPLLIDFGLVKQWDAADSRTRLMIGGMGTPEYSPPEQYSSHQGHTDARSDLYSLGATLYHALSGKAPLSVTDRVAIPENFVALQTAVPHLSPHLAAVIMQALDLQASNRFESAEVMLAALAAKTKPPSSGWGRWALLLVSFVILVGGLFWWFSDSSEARGNDSDSLSVVVTFGTPTDAPTPTNTLTATATLLPTATPSPTETVMPTETAVPSPTATPAPALPDVRVQAAFLANRPNIDGRFADWPLITSYTTPHRIFTGDDWSGEPDIASEWLFGWDNEFLYAAVTVKDDVHIQERRGNIIWRDDSVQIYLDLNGDFNSGLQDDDLHFTFVPGDFGNKPPYTHIFFGTDVSRGQAGDFVEIGSQRMPDGYTIELAIPWNRIGSRPEETAVMALSFTVEDTDRSNAANLEAVYANVAGQVYDNPNTWITFGLR